MSVSKRLRVITTGGGSGARALVTGVSKALRPFGGNMGTGDVRGTGTKLVQVITLNAFGATDSFKIRVNSFPRPPAGGTVARGGILATDTAAFVRGTNCASTDLQTALRTATGDSALTVSGTTDAGPFTVTFVNLSKHRRPDLQLVSLSGCSGNVTRSALAYDDPDASTVAGVSANGIRKDQESSLGFTQDYPLGYSVQSDGVGQTRGTELLPPTMVSAVGGVGQVVIDTTEVASGGTSAVVLFSIVNTLTGATPTVALTDAEDADGDLTIASLSAGDYYLLYHTQTAPAAGGGRISRPAAPEYFTVT